ncbi:hypothetical protein R3P38DRAFT_2575585, partial [Favolaschia claudopus]
VIASLIVNGTLVVLLAMTNHSRLVALGEWVYSSLGSPFTIPAILVLYGFILIYLLVSVYHLGNTEDASTRRRPSRTRLVPYYNSEGQLQGWVREEKSQIMPTTSRPQRKQNSSLPMPTPATAPAESDLAPAPVHQSTPPPLPQGTASAPPRLDEEAPLSTIPLPSRDGFPDGRLRCHFTPQQLEDTSQLAIYWVGDRLPGKQGSPTAATPEKGKVSRFQCAGVVECESKVCLTQIAPGANIARQVQSECTCGLKLRHRSCKVEWLIIQYRGGAVFECNHTHSHSRYTHSLSTPKSKPPQLQSFISRQPVSLMSSQPPESLNPRRADSPQSSVPQRDEGELTFEFLLLLSCANMRFEANQRLKIAQYRNPNYKIPKAILVSCSVVPRWVPLICIKVIQPQDAATNSDHERMIDPDAD